MMNIKNISSILELAELINGATTLTEAELAGRITQYNGHPWSEIWVPQGILDSATEGGQTSLYELGLALVKSGLGCVDRVRIDRKDMHGYVYVLYQTPTQGYSAQQQGGIRYMSNIEEFSEFFEDEDSDGEDAVKDEKALLDKMEKIQESLDPSSDSEAVEIETPKGKFNGVAIDDGRSPLEIIVPGANTYSLILEGAYWIKLLKEMPSKLEGDEKVFPFITWDNIPFDENGELPIEGYALHYDGYGRVGND